VVGELPYSKKASECQGKSSPKNYIVVIGLGEVAKKAKEMRPGKGDLIRRSGSLWSRLIPWMVRFSRASEKAVVSIPRSSW